MSVLAGFLAQQTVSGYDRLYLTPDLDDYSPAWINNLAYWASIPSPGAQTLTPNYPVSTTAYAKTGFIAHSYLDDFYYRIHITPPVLDIGNLLSVQTRQASVWNAYFVPQGLGSIVEYATEGLTESGITAPVTFTPLLEMTYSVTVDTHGPATIDALYQFVFPLESPTLEVIGRRVVVWSYPPNWAEPVAERLSWLTDVLTSQAGIEQRTGLRGVPRRGMDYALASLDRHQTNRLENVLLGWQARLFAVPIWTDVQILAANLAAGSLAIPCATAGYEWEADHLAVLWRAHDNYESVEIDTVGGSSLTLKSATLSAWPPGTRLYPVRLGQMPARQAFKRESGFYLSGNVSFDFQDNPGVTPADTGDLYLGYYVYRGKTNWRDDINIEASRQLEVLDYDTASPWVDDLSDLASLLKPWHAQLKGRAAIVAWRAWLAARDGRRVPFWSVSQAADLELTAPIGASDTTITVKNVGYARYINGRTDRRHLCIETVSGTRYYRQIPTSAEIDAATEQIGIDSALGALVAVADISSIRFMHLTRLDSDQAQIDWITPALAESSVMLRSLPI